MSKQYWNKFYQGLNTDQGIPYEPWLDSLILPQLLSLNEQSSALDIGCGLGLDSACLSNLGFKVLSSDISESALQQAKDLGHAKDVLLADAESLPRVLADKDFDFILANLSLHYMPHEALQKTLLGLVRLLKTPGQFVARFNHRSDINFGADKADERGYFRRMEEGEETLKVFYTEEVLRDICIGVAGELEVLCPKRHYSFEIAEADCQNFGRPKRLLTLTWSCLPT
ncbi:class I SAM-dependent methyltransferase [uncultured Pseudoteredinibacter sp.]|uniref:class I SAM-dependent methyltransferase n=1 Tax=uncultured Pseudoteredinibacter sp. TaxID=1641701 RepID=UPI0026126145|nr:class I SAM-dependent methyltransferase [uncultured Pseudoteredinibacter sp.]